MHTEVRGAKRTKDAELEVEDIEVLKKMNLIREIPLREVRGWVRAFTVTEVEKKRRRLILHTADLNTYLDTLFVKDDAQSEISIQQWAWEGVELPTPESISESVHLATAAVTCDIAWWYGHFALFELTNNFCFAFRGKFFASETGPTGHCLLPVMSQLVAVNFAKRVRHCVFERSGCTISFNVYIDNMRFLLFRFQNEEILESMSFDELTDIALRETVKAIEELSRLFRIKLNVDEMIVGKRYKFLGAILDHERVTVRINVTEKKRKWIQSIKKDTTTVTEVLGAFSGLYWCTRVLLETARFAAKNAYYILKFIRRVSNKLEKGEISLDSPISIWPSIKVNWIAMLEFILHLEKEVTPMWLNHLRSTKFFSDASLKGWGCVLFLEGRVFWKGDRWEDLDLGTHINVLEAKAAWYAVRYFISLAPPSFMSVDVMIDNTSVVANKSNQRSKNFLQNMYIYGILAMEKQHGLKFNFLWISTTLNLADPISRGNEPDDEGLRLENEDLIKNNPKTALEGGSEF
jgi:hypothetical protein